VCQAQPGPLLPSPHWSGMLGVGADALSRQERGAAGDKDVGCDRCLLQCKQREERSMLSRGGDELLRVPGEVDEIAWCGAMVRGESGPDGRAGGQCAGG
jgi:hypothetical protein